LIVERDVRVVWMMKFAYDDDELCIQVVGVITIVLGRKCTHGESSWVVPTTDQKFCFVYVETSSFHQSKTETQFNCESRILDDFNMHAHEISLRAPQQNLTTIATTTSTTTSGVQSPSPSPWFPGRYCASVRHECNRICVRLSLERRSNTKQESATDEPEPTDHRHFNYNEDDSLQHQIACRDAEAYIATMLTHPSHRVRTFNDWRYPDINDLSVVEMQLVNPSPMLSLTHTGLTQRTTRFSVSHLEDVLSQPHFWSTEEHNGASRVVSIGHEVCVQAYIYRLPTPNEMYYAPSNRPSRKIYLHDHIIAVRISRLQSPDQEPVPMSSILVTHGDGDMLNNTDINLLPTIRRDDSHSQSDDSNSTPLNVWSSSSSPDSNSSHRVRSRKARRNTINSNSRSGVPGLSISKDGTRFQAKIGSIRKSFSIAGAKRLKLFDPTAPNGDHMPTNTITTTIPTTTTDIDEIKLAEAITSRHEETYMRALEFIGQHSTAVGII